MIRSGAETKQNLPAYIYVITKGDMGKNVMIELKELVGPEIYSLASEFSPMRSEVVWER